VQVHARALKDPPLDQCGLVRGGVVEDEVQVQLGRRGRIDRVEQVPELLD
jgi:hypothetical protein